MTGVVVRSTANISRSPHRVSTVLHRLWPAVVAFLPGLLRQIPVAARRRAGIHGFKLVDPAPIRRLARFGKGEVAIYFATMLTIVAVDLLAGADGHRVGGVSCSMDTAS